MKKQVKRIVAIVAALAMVVTSMAFTPAKLDASTQTKETKTCPAHGKLEGSLGVWNYEVHAEGHGWSVDTTYSNFNWTSGDPVGEGVTNFDYSQDTYCWEGNYLSASDLKDIYGLTEGTTYDCSITLEEKSTSQPSDINLSTTGGDINIAAETKNAAKGTDLVWQGTVKPNSNPLILKISYGNKNNAYVGGFTIKSVTFTEQVPTTPAPGTGTITAPAGSVAAGKDYQSKQETVDLWQGTVISGYQDNDPDGLDAGDYFWDVSASLTHADSINGFNAVLSDYSFPGSYWKASLAGMKDTDNNPLEAGSTYACTVSITETTNDKDNNYADINVRTEDGSTNLAAESKTGAAGAETLTWTGTVVPGNSGGNPLLTLAIGYGNDGEDTGSGGYAGGFTVNSVTFAKQVVTTPEPTTPAPGTGTIVAPASSVAEGKEYLNNEQTVDLWTGTVISGYQDNDPEGLDADDYFWDVTASLTNADKINSFSASLDKYSFPGSYWKGNLSSVKDTDGNSLAAGTSYNCSVTLVENTTDEQDRYAPITVSTSGFTEDMTATTKTTGGTMTWTGVVKAGADTPYLNIGYGNDGVGHGYGLGGLAGGFTVQSVTFEAIVDPYTSVPRNTEDYHPDNNNNNPWALTVLNNGTNLWGDMSYLVDGTASVVDNTSIRIDNVAHDDASAGVDQDNPSDWWWYNGGKIDNYYDTSQWVVGKGYTGSFTFNYTAPDPATQYAKKIRVIYDGHVIVEPVSAGTNTINLPEISYNGTLPTIEFNFDLLEKGSIISVSDVSFTLTNDWNWQDDTQVSLQTIQNKSTGGSGTSTLNWTLYSATQSGEGCKLFYKTETDQQTGLKDVKVKVGEGNRWDPICAQFNVSNSSAYHDLTANTTYYMTYKFNSTAAGTVHFTQEGYPPNAIERFDVVAGENTYTKVMTYMPNQDTGNIKMSLTPTTYADGGTVVQDGAPLPVDTILSDFEITFSRQDDEGWTIVTDSREASQGSQVYDTLVPNLTAYTNSNYGGRLSYKTNDYDLGEDAIAKTSIRVDNLPGSTFTNTTWPASMRIPNNYFYNRTDTNGDPLVDGDQYTLRFFMNVDLPDGVSSGTVYFKQEGYDDEHAYTVTDGLNMLGGTIQAKSGYTSHDNYDKTGGIDMTYDADKTTTTQEYNTQVIFDLSEMPNGAIINDVSWEFYADPPAATYNVSIDGQKVAEVQPGGSYTLPTGQGAATVGYLIDGAQGADQVVYKPGATKSNIQSDINFISVNSVTAQVGEGAAMKLDNENKRGIAFQGTFKVNNATTNIDTDAFTTGMLIATETCYTDQCEGVLDLDKAALYPNGIVNVVNGAGDTQKWLTGKPGQYRAGIINIADQNITRNFISRAYYTINYSDGTSETHYSALYSDEDYPKYVRSIQQVATLIKLPENLDYYNSLTSGQREIVDYCADYKN